MTGGATFPASPVRITLRVVAVIIYVIAGISFAVLAFATPVVQSDFALRALAVAVIVGLVVVGTFGAITDRPPSVDSTGITLPRSIRRGDGTLSRRIGFSDIADIRPTVIEGYNGLDITLSDGVRTFLPQGEFGRSGLDVMNALGARFGRSFQDDIAKILLKGLDGQRFRVVRVVGRTDRHLTLSEPIPTFSGPTIRRTPRSVIKFVEHVSTPYQGGAFLVTLLDGTRFLIPEQDGRNLASSSAGSTG